MSDESMSVSYREWLMSRNLFNSKPRTIEMDLSFAAKELMVQTLLVA